MQQTIKGAVRDESARFSGSAEERSHANSSECHTSEYLRPNPTAVLRGSVYSVNAPRHGFTLHTWAHGSFLRYDHD